MAMMILRAVVIGTTAAIVLASSNAGAQPSCQPTILQPCAPQPRLDQSADPSKPSGSSKSDQPARASRRGFQVAPDTTFGLGGRGLGVQRQF
jgi:hypothetical protein